jgi:hypothetical protein
MKRETNEARPLSKHERAEILAMIEVIAGTQGGSRLEELVEALVAAEEYWREKAKAAGVGEEWEC